MSRVSFNVVLPVLGGVLLGLPYLYPDLFVLSWLAFVPLLFALRETTLKQAYVRGLLFGAGFYPMVWYWFVEFAQVLKGYPFPLALFLSCLFWLYCAQLTALLALGYRFLQRHLPVSPFLLFPLCVVTAYSLWPMLFPVQLGESQSRFLWAIQAADLVGVYGVDFMIGLGNILLFLLLSQPSETLRQLSTALASLVLLLWLGYGVVSLSFWQKDVAGWPQHKVGIVQPNQPPSEAVPPPEPGYTRAYPLEMELTEKLVAAGAEWVVWPETRYKGYFDDPVVSAAYRRNVERLGAPLIFHDLRTEYSDDEKNPDKVPDKKEYNTLVALDRNGKEVLSYQKTKLVMFGETLPFMNDSPAMQELLGQYGGEFFKQISPGSGPTNVALDGFRLAPAICYEVMFPEFAAEAVQGHAAGSVLVTISNNAWFGQTSVSLMHFNASVLRSVENRVSQVHAINNGASGFILPTGEVTVKTEFMQQAGYLAELPYDANQGGSLYTRYPSLFINAAYVVLLVLFGVALFRSRFRQT